MRSNQELIDLIKKGDHPAFREIFDLFSKKVYGYAYSFLRRKQISEDITQEVFKRFWEKRVQLNSVNSLDSIFYTLTYHAIIDEFRREKRRGKLLEFKNADDYSYSHAEDLAVTRNMESLYQQAVNRLPEKRKQIFILSRHEGMNNREIANELKISPKTVENQMTAALRSLRSFFKNLQILMIFW